MGAEELLIRRVIVAASGAIYWAGVLMQARRIRKQIGRPPNLTPRGKKEQILWIGWLLVIVAWIGQPFLAGFATGWVAVKLMPLFIHPAGLVLGIGLAAGGYAATLWCYATMGSAWRIGVDQKERNALVTDGLFSRVRHPIYALQVVMLAGAFLLLPTFCSVAVLVFHLVCVWSKAADEEAYLLATHGESYRAHVERTGRLFPKF